MVHDFCGDMAQMQKTRLAKIARINYQANTTVREQLHVSGKVRNLFLKLSAQNAITDSTSGTVVARSPGSLVNNLSLIVDREITLKQGRWVDWVDRAYMYGKQPAETQDTVANNTTEVLSRIMIPFATPGSIRGVDTVLDMDRHQRLDLEVSFGDTESQVAGCADATISSGYVDVIAEVSRTDPTPLAYFIERGFDSANLGTSANSALEIELTKGPRQNYHHLCLVAEDNPGSAGRGLVSTALNEIRIEQQGQGGLTTPLGPIPGDVLQHEFDMKFDRGGVVTGLYPMVWQPRFDGRATYNLATAGLTDLRFVIDHDGFSNAGYLRTLQGTFEPIVFQ